MRHLFLVNPAAGKPGSTERLTRQICQTLDPLGLEYQVRLTSGPGHAQALARAACETGEDLRLYACGGDGTLNEVVNGAAGYANAAVTNVPKGTGNDFLKIFGPQNTQRFTDLSALLDGPQAAMDLMDCNGKLGIGIVCAGMDARVAADVDRYKQLPLISGPGAYLISLAVNFLFKPIATPLSVDLGDRKLEQDITIICVCNGRYYGGGFMPVGDAQPDDGVLDMLVVPKVGRLTFARLLGAYAKGRYRDHPEYILEHHGTAVTFSSPGPMVAVVDGEVMRDTTFTVRLSPHKLNFFYPPDLSYSAQAGTLAAAL